MRNVIAQIKGLDKAMGEIKQALCDLDARYHCGDVGLTEYIEKRNQMRSLLRSCETAFINKCSAFFDSHFKKIGRKAA